MLWHILGILVVLSRTSIGLCPQGTYESRERCHPCPTNCYNCSSQDYCNLCQPSKVLYNHHCLDQCPPSTLHQLNDTNNQQVCLDPTMTFDYSQTFAIFPFSQTKNYFQQSPDLLYSNREGSTKNGILAGWIKISNIEMNGSGTFLEV